MRLATIPVALFLICGCSDDISTPVREKGVVAEKGIVAEKGVVAEKGAVPREGGAVDGTAVDFSAVCKTVVSTCSGSKYWTGYVNPFTVDNCTTIFNCVAKLYTPTCLAKFKALAACMGTFSSAAECESKCVANQADVGSNCPCPGSCGVKGCPEAGI